MRITADTNVLLRAVLEDDKEQASAARALLLRATIFAVPVPVFCEFVWVLKRGYGCQVDEIAGAIEAICEIDVVTTDHPAVEAGLKLLRAGGDFADGVIAHQGEGYGESVFSSFDRDAVALLKRGGAEAAEVSELIGSDR